MEKPIGVSGIMRVKNDSEFINTAVESCISALDELIIVYNDCSDNSPDIIETIKQKYPLKIKVYEYIPKIYSVNLTKEEYEKVKNLPPDSEHLLCNYYNFALSKVSYRYALKIDADQFYFTDELKEWCDIYRNSKGRFSFSVVLGFLIWLYIKVFKLLGNKIGIVLPLFSRKIFHFAYPLYISFVKYCVGTFSAQVSLSGLNVFYDKEWYITLGRMNPFINILPPYNGTGDHLIFKVTKNTYYVPFDSLEYKNQRSDKYSYIEQFHGDKYPFPIGVFWFHMNAMRDNVKQKVKNVKSEHSDYFSKIDRFTKQSYIKDIDGNIPEGLAGTNERALFNLLHMMNIDNIKCKYLKYLKPYEKDFSNSSNL